MKPRNEFSRFLAGCLALGVLALSDPSAIGRASAGLFLPLEPSAHRQSDEHTGVSVRRQARVNWQHLIVRTGSELVPATRLEMDLFPDSFLVATLDRVEVQAETTWVWLGRLTTPQPSSVLLAVRNGELSGRIVAGATTFYIRPIGPGLVEITDATPEATAANILPSIADTALPTVNRPSLFGGGRLGDATFWLTALNLRRAEAGVPPVAENLAYSVGNALHARYLVKTGILGLDGAHAENPSGPWYTPDGDAAGRSSNTMESQVFDTTDQFAVDGWVEAPFHAIQMFNPGLREVGFGSYREAGGAIQMAAGLDVTRGRIASINYPVMWPRNGVTITPPNPQLCPRGTACFSRESPSPLAHCPGYSAPSGLPIVIAFGPRSTMRVSSSTLTSEGVALPHCLVDDSYTNPVPSEQDLVRSLLRTEGAVVLMPRDPLPLGKTYTVSIVANGAPLTWSFSLGTTLTLSQVSGSEPFPGRKGLGFLRPPGHTRSAAR
jgi:hypothetical protein